VLSSSKRSAGRPEIFIKREEKKFKKNIFPAFVISPNLIQTTSWLY
jgi:hypothetical protein